MRKLNVISLFTGAGGLEIAACSSGLIRQVVSTDSNSTFLETTKINLPKHFPDVKHKIIAANVCELSGEMLLNLLKTKPDLIMGGPPCDDFTQYGLRKGMEGEKGPLILEYLRLVKELKPRCFVFENVPNLVHQFRPAFDRFISLAGDIGYSVNWKLLKACDFGSPTIRKRVFVVGWRNDLDISDFCFPEPTHFPKAVSPKCTSKKVLSFSLVSEVLRDLPDVKTIKADRYLNHTGRFHRPNTIEHMKTVPQGVKINKSYRYRAPWDGVCRSLTAGLDDSTKSYIHPIYHREMSVREYARIHGFPDTWFFCGTHHNGIKQVANAVPIALGTAVLGSIIHVLSNISGVKDEKK